MGQRLVVGDFLALGGQNGGVSGSEVKQTLEFRLALGSNPEFTSSVLVAYARAVMRMRRMGDIGAKTAFDVAPGLLSPKSAADLRKELL